MEYLTKLLSPTVLLLLSLVSESVSLECYACSNQDSNVDKCVKTTKQCEEHQSVCSTHLKWGLPPYWIPYGTRQHYVEKDCDTETGCNEKRLGIMRKCRRDWWDDWECWECCSGDMCNYYATLGSGHHSASIILTTICSCFTAFRTLL